MLLSILIESIICLAGCGIIVAAVYTLGEVIDEIAIDIKNDKLEENEKEENHESRLD